MFLERWYGSVKWLFRLLNLVLMCWLYLWTGVVLMMMMIFLGGRAFLSAPLCACTTDVPVRALVGPFPFCSFCTSPPTTRCSSPPSPVSSLSPSEEQYLLQHLLPGHSKLLPHPLQPSLQSMLNMRRSSATIFG